MTPDTILAQRFSGIQRNQCFPLFQGRRLCDDVFSALADEFGDFGAVFGTALKERNQTFGYKKHGGMSAYRKRFVILTRGGSSKGAAGLQPSLKNVRQKIPPNGQTRLKSGFSQHNHFFSQQLRNTIALSLDFHNTIKRNFTTQSFSVPPTPFWLNVS